MISQHGSPASVLPTLPEGDTRGKPRRRLLIVSAQTAVTIALLWLLSRQADFGAVWSAIRGADVALLAISFLLMLARLPLAGARWRLLLDRRGYALSTRYLTHVLFRAQFTATLLPAATGADLMRGLYLRRHVRAADLVQTMLADRAAGLLSLVLLACVPSAWVITRRPGLAGVAITVAALAAIAAAALAIAARAARARAGERGTGAYAAMGRAAASVGRVAADGPLMARLIALSLAFQFVGVASVYLVGLAVGATASVFYYVLFLPLVWLWMTLPVSINGIGVRESAFVFYFGLVGMSPEMSLTISAIVFAQGVLQGMLAGAVTTIDAAFRR